MKIKTKILIVEDESIIALNLKETLKDFNYEPCGVAADREKVMKILEKGVRPDLILMDIYLKGNTTGIELAKELKSIIPETPVIFLTANSELSTIQKASEVLAYGYLIKPFKKNELRAQIEVALKKAQNDKDSIKKLDAIENVNKSLLHKLSTSIENKSTTIQLKYGYLYDKEKCILYFADQPIKLTTKEKKIIELLCKSPGHLVSQEQLEYAIWQDKPAGYAAFRSVLFRLRNKIHKDLIKNQNNTGYKIELLE